MKHLYLFIFFLSGLAIKAQIPVEVRDIDNANALVSNNEIFHKTTTAGGTDFSFHFEIKNTSANTITVSVRKYEDLINTVTISDLAEAYFCFNTYCYIPTVITATTQLTAGSTFTFIPKLDEASVVGESNVRYRISAEGNNLYVVLKYNAPVGLKDLSNNNNFLSLYPNPCSDNFTIEFENEKEQFELAVYNSIGSKVITENKKLSVGKNKVNVNTQSLSPGIYFIQISQGEKKLTKKIIINN